jgi:hypothetical protein
LRVLCLKNFVNASSEIPLQFEMSNALRFFKERLMCLSTLEFNVKFLRFKRFKLGAW